MGLTSTAHPTDSVEPAHVDRSSWANPEHVSRLLRAKAGEEINSTWNADVLVGHGTWPSSVVGAIRLTGPHHERAGALSTLAQHAAILGRLHGVCIHAKCPWL